ncbi:hypothetical protein VCSRO18_0808 [Vibrio cholerae]|nr:hypothetical protein VCSRO18_0808 [Vibrio cholerae]
MWKIQTSAKLKYYAPLPLIGGGWEGVFRARRVKTWKMDTSEKLKYYLPLPLIGGGWEGVFHARGVK